jgi:hypothetical protein
MNEANRSFPHIKLKFLQEGTASSLPFATPTVLTTQANIEDRVGHGNKLKASILGITTEWQDRSVKRKQEGKTDLPEVLPLIIQVDPTAFNCDAENLSRFGIELVSEPKDGYILAISNDIQLTDLQKKIEQFINSERGGGQIPKIWEIISGTKRLEYILSPELKEQWGEIQDWKIYTVEIGILCGGNESDSDENLRLEGNDEKSKNYSKNLLNLGLPNRNEKYLGETTRETNDNEIVLSRNWNPLSNVSNNIRWNDNNLTYQQWDDIKRQREDELYSFVDQYQGEIVNIIDGGIGNSSTVPDSFSCQINISGKGLKDLVFNFPYIFEINIPDDVYDESSRKTELKDVATSFVFVSPNQNAPKVCIIDSGIQEKHPLLRPAIKTNDSRSWVPNETELTADLVRNGGHGTRVAGAVLYPNLIPTSGQQQAVCWLQNARVLDKDCRLSKSLFPPALISNIVKFYQGERGTRIFNHSIAASTPCRTQYMSAWAAEIDNLSWQHDILFIVAAGNLPTERRINNSRLSVRDHLQNEKPYPEYLLSDSCRVPNPAQSFQALTVGSVSLQTFKDLSRKSIAQQDYPSSFSCTGLGIWDSIKPEVVEYGGDVVSDGSTPPSLTTPPEVCPDLVRSTLNGGPMSARDCIGTSFAAPKVAHIAACLAAELPNESCLLYRALIVQSARLPSWVETENFDLYNAVRLLGYGIPNLDRALFSSSHRITLFTEGGDKQIAARQAQIYEVILPDGLRSQGDELDIRIEVTLSYKAQPRRTRRTRRKYLSTWLDWECSKKGEVPERFLERVLKEYEAPPELEEKGRGFKWVLGKQKKPRQAHSFSRQGGTLQKDWAIVKSYDLRESFCIAVVGHEGWNNDPSATVPYALVVSFEAVDTNISIYTPIAIVQKVSTQVETEISIQP